MELFLAIEKGQNFEYETNRNVGQEKEKTKQDRYNKEEKSARCAKDQSTDRVSPRP